MLLNGYVLQKYDALYEHRADDFVLLQATGTLTGTSGSQTLTVDLEGQVKDGATVYILTTLQDVVGASGRASAAYDVLGQQAIPDDADVSVFVLVKHKDIKPVLVD
tara:strand:+ start:1427 stop:1744 length:318 start_codon:yes stop_codon:yes gene_type:complete